MTDIFSAFRLLHSDGKYGIWIPARAASREDTDAAVNKLCKDKSVLGFERKDITEDEYKALFREVKHAFVLHPANYQEPTP